MNWNAQRLDSYPELHPQLLNFVRRWKTLAVLMNDSGKCSESISDCSFSS